jgi:hypothetical protein
VTEREIREAMERYGRMQRINRIGRRTVICMIVIAAVALTYWAFH